jgi:DNA-binding NarL/FixJ family response regulator
MSIRIIIADDQAVVRSGFRAILEDEPDLEVVGDAADGIAAVEVARSRSADVVLMDVRMPRLDGLQATRRLAGPGVEDPIDVIVVTTFDLDDYVFGALRAGAAGFLLKDASPETLVTAIRTVASGHGLIAPEVTRRLIARFAAATPDPGPQARAGTAERARARGAPGGRPRQVQRPDRAAPVHRGGHRQEPRLQRPAQARPSQPRPGRDPRLRNRPRLTRNPNRTGLSRQLRRARTSRATTAAANPGLRSSTAGPSGPARTFD